MAREVGLFVDREDLRLTEDGRWLSNEEEIAHQETVRAFFRGIERFQPTPTTSGWRVRVGTDTKSVEVEGTGWFVDRLAGSTETGFVLTLSDGASAPLDPRTLRYEGDGRLFCCFAAGNRGQSQELARFRRGPYLELLRNAEEVNGSHYLRIQGLEIKLDPGHSGPE